MTNEEFRKLADKFNEENDIKTVGELIKQLETLPKETKIFYDYAGLSATVYEEVQTLFIGS